MKIQGKKKDRLLVICTPRLKSEPEIEILASGDQIRVSLLLETHQIVLENVRKKKLTTKKVWHTRGGTAPRSTLFPAQNRCCLVPTSHCNITPPNSPPEISHSIKVPDSPLPFQSPTPFTKHHTHNPHKPSLTTDRRNQISSRFAMNTKGHRP